MYKHKVIEQTRLKIFDPQSYVVLEPEIISSADNPFAIADTIEKFLEGTKEFLFISAPWIGKSFIDKVRGLPKGIEIRLLTREPYEKDKYYYRTIRTLESFVEEANTKGFRLDIVCRQSYFHPKLIISDHNIVLSGSVNPTSSGMYDNDEILYVFRDPRNIKRHIDIFNAFYNDPRNISWKDFRQYQGIKNYSNYHSKIAEAILGIFERNNNENVHEDFLYDAIVRKGYSRNEVIKAAENLLNGGILFRPKQGFLRLT